MRRGARAMFAVYQATVPWVSVLVRKVYGIAGAAHGDASRLNLRYAWPSGDWGSLPIAGGLEAAYRRDLEAAEDPDALRAEIARDSTRCGRRSVLPNTSASRRSSIHATPGRSCATGRSEPTSSWLTRRGGPKARGPRP